jgi:RNase P subunit RPR2
MNKAEIMCRGCGESHETNEDKWVDEMTDAYGYSTGWWCHECYDSDRYPYRKDRYFDPSYAGERLEDDY